MAMLKNKKNIGIFLTMLILVLSNCSFFATVGIQSYFEYGAYFLILCSVLFYFVIEPKPMRVILQNLIVCAAVSILFSIGILVQDLAFTIKLRLIATMFVISITAILGEDYLNSPETIRVAAYGIFVGTILTTGICVLTGTPIMEYVYEGILPYGFTGGMLYKNFYAAVLLGSFMGLFFYHRHGRPTAFDKNLMAVQVILILLSCARGTYIFLVAFLFLIHLPQLRQLLMRSFLFRRMVFFWKKWKKPFRIIVTVGGITIGVLLFVWAFITLITVSATYAIRYRGVFGYLDYVKGDWFGILFGNAGTVWGHPYLDYIARLRQMVGWNTSFEVAFLNTLIKNGVLGLLGFLLIFTHKAVYGHHMGTKKTKLMLYTVLTILLLSSLVESFVSNLHSIFGIVCYLYMAGLCGMSRSETCAPDTCTTPWQLLRQPFERKR